MNELYDFACSQCGHVMMLKPSLAMQMGMNTGHGTCNMCKTFLHLWVDGEIARSEPWDDYAVRLKAEKPAHD